MTQPLCKTKVGNDPGDKPKVYFSCHPDDFERTFDTVCEDIFKTHDCAIYYKQPHAALESPDLFQIYQTFSWEGSLLLLPFDHLTFYQAVKVLCLLIRIIILFQRLTHYKITQRYWLDSSGFSVPIQCSSPSFYLFFGSLQHFFLYNRRIKRIFTIAVSSQYAFDRTGYSRISCAFSRASHPHSIQIIPEDHPDTFRFCLYDYRYSVHDPITEWRVTHQITSFNSRPHFRLNPMWFLS